MTDNALEIGADLAHLFDDKEREAALRWAVLANSSPIASVKIENDVGIIRFENGATLTFIDNGQSCCESRYLTCDDDLASVKGGYLRRIEVADVSDENGEWEVHEQQFLKVRTTAGDFTIAAHNQHNGYYGGFSLNFVWEEPKGGVIQ